MNSNSDCSSPELIICTVVHTVTCAALSTCGTAVIVCACMKRRRRRRRGRRSRELEAELQVQSLLQDSEEAVVDPGVREGQAHFASGVYMYNT